MRLAGHLWTLVGHLRRQRRQIALPPVEPWSTEVADAVRGSVRLTGELIRGERPEALLIVHGLGGSSASGYVRAAAAAACRHGLTNLRVNLRGADRLGEDYYHGGLTADLHAAVTSPPLADAERVLILGFSLGGHVMLRYLLDGPDSRVESGAAICAPLDLAACCDWIDRPVAWIYRRYLLGMLMEIYRPVAARHEVPVPVDQAARIRGQRAFDDLVIAPRHGFDGVDDYYRQVSVGPDLGKLAKPTLLVLAEDDPMIPRPAQASHLVDLPPVVDVRWVRGGHVGFPARLDLGEPGPLGLEQQVITWLIAPRTMAGSAPSAC